MAHKIYFNISLILKMCCYHTLHTTVNSSDTRLFESNKSDDFKI